MPIALATQLGPPTTTLPARAPGHHSLHAVWGENTVVSCFPTVRLTTVRSASSFLSLQVVRSFFDVNRRLSTAVASHWGHTKINVFREYSATVARALQRPDIQRVTDVGAGAAVPYSKERSHEDGAYIIGLDVASEAMAKNPDLDERRVADIVASPLPFSDGELDMIVSSSVLEHLENLENFVNESARVLRPGGLFIHVFPSRYALFAVLNRTLPHRISRSLLYFFHPQVIGVQGFKAYYDHCYATAYCRLLTKHGFTITEIKTSYYGSSPYFSIFFPAFIVSFIYEALAKSTGLPDLCTTLMVSAIRSDD